MQNENLTMTNFRDFGGIKTQDGKTFKFGKIYRTGYLMPKTYEDWDYLESIKLDSVVDLRSGCEITEHPDLLPDGVKYFNVPVFTHEEEKLLGLTQSMVVKLLFSSKERIDTIRKGMYDSYEYIPYRVDSYMPLFDALNRHETVAFHCTAGKDRTGIGALIIMLAMGCDLDTCIQEYLLSNEYQKRNIDHMLKQLKYLPIRKYVRDFCVEMSSVHEPLIRHTLDSIHKKYETIEDFLYGEYGITKEKIEDWKNFYLE